MPKPKPNLSEVPDGPLRRYSQDENDNDNIIENNQTSFQGDPGPLASPKYVEKTRKFPYGEPDYFWLALVSMAKHGGIYVLSDPLLRMLLPGYKKSSLADQVDLRTRIVSTVHAVTVTYNCMDQLLRNKALADDPYVGVVPEARMNLSNSAGYFFTDAFVLLRHWGTLAKATSVSLNVQMMLHHIIAGGGFSICVYYSNALWFGTLRLLSEFSTPFLNFRAFLHTLGMKDSRLYKANAMATVAAFFLCRILVMPYYWKFLAKTWNTEKNTLNPFKRKLLISLGLILDGLNVVWFKLLVQGLARTMKQKKLK